MINIDTHESEIPEGSGKRRSAYRSEIHTYRQERGRTHCQIVPLELPLQIQALRPKLEPEVLGTLGRLCAVHLLPKAPEIGTLVLFSLNDEISVPFTDTISEHERVSISSLWQVSGSISRLNERCCAVVTGESPRLIHRCRSSWRASITGG